MAGPFRDKIHTRSLLSSVSATGPGNSVEPDAYTTKRTFQISASNPSGVCTSFTAAVEVSNDNNNWITSITTTVATTTATTVTTGFSVDAPWRYVRGDLVTATTATVVVNITMGY